MHLSPVIPISSASCPDAGVGLCDASKSKTTLTKVTVSF